MRHRQIKVRLEALIRKKQDCIRTYKSAIVRTRGRYKHMRYHSIVASSERSMERVREALQYIESNPHNEFTLKGITEKFKFKSSR
jgi:YesN/AraC family two-component response regulator